jgi:hypothetical protein
VNNLHVDEQRRIWIAYPEAIEDIGSKGQEGMEVKITLPMSHNS